MIPWVPMEERFKIRNFKTQAGSTFNMAYLDQVRAVTLKLLQTHIVNLCWPLENEPSQTTTRSGSVNYSERCWATGELIGRGKWKWIGRVEPDTQNTRIRNRRSGHSGGWWIWVDSQHTAGQFLKIEEYYQEGKQRCLVYYWAIWRRRIWWFVGA